MKNRWDISGKQRIILNAILAAGIPVGPREISLATGVRGENVRSLLPKLLRKLVVKKVGYGKYTPMSASERLDRLPQPRCIDELHPRHFRQGF